MKKILALVLTLSLLLSCGVFAMAEEEAIYDNGMTYAKGFPITKEPITLTVYVSDAGTLRPNMDTTKVIDYIAEKTNITLDITLISEADQIAMMFVSGEYPDMTWNVGATNQQVADAAEAGDLVELTPYIQEVCPTWAQFYKDYPLAYAGSLESDGSQYKMSFANFAPFDRDLRDMFMVSDKWCEELNIEIPTTIAEYTDYLRAIRDNAGKGTIPAAVEPLHFHKDNGVGGYIDFFNFFGVTVSQPDFLTVFDGKVEYMAIKPEAKEVIKYLRSLYDEGLIKPESFTDDWNMHLSRIKAVDASVGSFFAYNNENLNYFTPISPLDAENGKKPTIRRQTYGFNGNHFMMFSNNKYPYATMRLMEAIVDWKADPAFCQTFSMGLEGYIWEYNEDGRIVEGYINDDGILINYQDEHEDWEDHYGFWNSTIGMRTPDWYEGPYYEIQEDAVGSRAWAFKNFYKDWVNDADTTYVNGALSMEDNERMVELQADIKNHRQTTFANWICGVGDIDAEWDAYVERMYQLNVEEWLALKQKAYNVIYPVAE